MTQEEQKRFYLLQRGPEEYRLLGSYKRHELPAEGTGWMANDPHHQAVVMEHMTTEEKHRGFSLAIIQANRTLRGFSVINDNGISFLN